MLNSSNAIMQKTPLKAAKEPSKVPVFHIFTRLAVTYSKECGDKIKHFLHNNKKIKRKMRDTGRITRKIWRKKDKKISKRWQIHQKFTIFAQ